MPAPLPCKESGHLGGAFSTRFRPPAINEPYVVRRQMYRDPSASTLGGARRAQRGPFRGPTRSELRHRAPEHALLNTAAQRDGLSHFSHNSGVISVEHAPHGRSGWRVIPQCRTRTSGGDRGGDRRRDRADSVRAAAARRAVRPALTAARAPVPRECLRATCSPSGRSRRSARLPLPGIVPSGT